VPNILEREILLAPNIVCRAAAAATSGRAQQWMLGQPRDVRRSYVHEVIDAGGGELAQSIWMLRSSAAVRASYLREVAALEGAGPQVAWMLMQPDEVRESYVREVLRRN
jgi:hypothetical protein